jgi:hypothetical protein
MAAPVERSFGVPQIALSGAILRLLNDCKMKKSQSKFDWLF